MKDLRQNPILPFESILIYGMGMMGASLAWAIRKHPAFTGKVTGIVRSERSAAHIRENELADDVLVVSSPEELSTEILNQFELIIIGLPVEKTCRLFDTLPETNALITDMSSTRRSVHESALKRPGLRFVGSHPMCGSEDQGPQALVENLYRDRLCIITPADISQNTQTYHKTEDVTKIENFWQALDMHTHLLDPESHDRMLVYLSHGPHILSSALALWAAKNKVVEHSLDNSPHPLTGGGFKDMSRIAGSNPEMWTDIMETNQDNLIDSLKDFQKEIEEAITLLEKNNREDWSAYFKKARRSRNILCGYEEDR